MTTLYCDLCGASYPDTEEKCPICGSARALLDETPYSGYTHSVREKVRGGRYSKKNVEKRLMMEVQKADTIPSNLVRDDVNLPEEDDEPMPVFREPQEVTVCVPMEAEEDSQEKKALRKARRRNTALNLLLALSVVLFLASTLFLVEQYALPFMHSMGWIPDVVMDTVREFVDKVLAAVSNVIVQ